MVVTIERRLRLFSHLQQLVLQLVELREMEKNILNASSSEFLRVRTHTKVAAAGGLPLPVRCRA